MQLTWLKWKIIKNSNINIFQSILDFKNAHAFVKQWMYMQLLKKTPLGAFKVGQVPVQFKLGYRPQIWTGTT